jgi:hypothetical protein
MLESDALSPLCPERAPLPGTACEAEGFECSYLRATLDPPASSTAPPPPPSNPQSTLSQDGGAPHQVGDDAAADASPGAEDLEINGLPAADAAAASLSIVEAGPGDAGASEAERPLADAGVLSDAGTPPPDGAADSPSGPDNSPEAGVVPPGAGLELPSAQCFGRFGCVGGLWSELAESCSGPLLRTALYSDPAAPLTDCPDLQPASGTACVDGLNCRYGVCPNGAPSLVVDCECERWRERTLPCQ